MADANTAWSLANYHKTAEVAAALGVDPQLARSVIATTMRLPLPSSVKQQMVLAALKTGLYSLRWLRGWERNVTGKLRVNKLLSLVEGGHTLPLIFPREDIGFAYDVPGSTKEAHAEWCEDRLVLGGRAPHCWLTMGEEQQYFASTIELPALLHRLLLAASSASENSVPPAVIIVSGAHFDRCMESLGLRIDELHRHVCVVVVDQQDQPAPTHRQLQHLWQRPCYTATEREPACDRWSACTNLNSQLAQSSFGVEASELLSSRLLRSSEGGIKLLRVKDVTGRWGSLVGGSSAGPPSVVGVRPDGHVAAVGSVDSLDQFAERMRAALWAKNDVVL